MRWKIEKWRVGGWGAGKELVFDKFIIYVRLLTFVITSRHSLAQMWNSDASPNSKYYVKLTDVMDWITIIIMITIIISIYPTWVAISLKRCSSPCTSSYPPDPDVPLAVYLLAWEGMQGRERVGDDSIYTSRLVITNSVLNFYGWQVHGE